MLDDLRDLSIRDYEQPKYNREIFTRIEQLKQITDSIENNLIAGSPPPDSSQSYKIDYQGSLNPEQYAAATTIDGPMLVIAGAGSGKTRTIIYRVAFMLEAGIDPRNVLLLTFTRKAAGEMISRASALLGDDSTSHIFAGTFHSFANHMLRRYSKLLGLASNFTIIDTIDSEDIIDQVRRTIPIKKRKKAFPRKGRVQNIISKARNCELPIAAVVEREYSNLTEFVPDIILISRGYADYKRRNNILDFDDLMDVLREGLKSNSQFRDRLQDRFRYIMVDEFQDTNTAQKEIVDEIAAGHRNIMVVGDDSQSIYAFRGANFENILRFPQTYPDCRLVKIEQNYRSSSDILNFTNSVIDKAQIGYRKKLYSLKSPRGKPVVKKFPTQEDEAAFIVSKIKALEDIGVQLSEMAVLYRASYHGNFIQAELLKHNIPYVVYGGIKFVERRHVKDLLAHLRILLNSKDAVSWSRVLRIIPGIGKITIAKIISGIHQDGFLDKSKYQDKKYGKHIAELADTLEKCESKKASIPAKIEVLKEYYAPLLMGLEADYELRLMDLDVLYDLALRYDDLERFLSDFALDPPTNKFNDQSSPAIDNRGNDSLVLSTIHSAKGLEWNVVFVCHLLDGLFPPGGAIVDVERIEEERRLFYVACTRAKDELYLTYPSYVSSWDSFLTLPSRFLVEVEKHTYVN